MTWFRIDDSFHSHPKVLATSPAALGLWAVAGSWAGANLSDGFVPDHVLPRLLPDSTPLAKELVSTGLWRRAKGGYRFHDWIDFNPAAETVRAEREAARRRMREIRQRRKGAPGQGGSDVSVTSARPERDLEKQDPSDFHTPVNNAKIGGPKHEPAGRRPNRSGERSGEQPANVREKFVTPTRPDPTLKGGSSSYVAHADAREEPPPPRCPEHIDTPATGPCGPCGDARRARQQHERDQAAAEARRIAEAPRCRTHRGQLAATCGPCRSEQLAADRGDQP